MIRWILRGFGMMRNKKNDALYSQLLFSVRSADTVNSRLSDSPQLIDTLNVFAKEDFSYLCKSLSTLSTLNDSKQIFLRYEQDLLKGIKSATVDNILNILRTACEVKFYSQEMLQLACIRANELINDFQLGEIGYFLRYLHMRKYRDEELETKLVAKAVENIVKNPRDVAKTIQNFVEIGNFKFIDDIKEKIERIREQLNLMEKAYIIHSCYQAGIKLDLFIRDVLSDLHNLSAEDFGLFSTFLPSNSDFAKTFKFKIMESLELRELSLFTHKSLALLINSFQEIDMGKYITEKLHDHILAVLPNMKTATYPIIIYVYGCNKAGSAALWEIFKSKVLNEKSKLQVKEIIWILYGFHISQRHNNDIYNLLIKQLGKRRLNQKDLEKLIEIAGTIKDIKILKSCLEQFKKEYLLFRPSKGLIAVNIFIENKMMDDQLRSIMHEFKSLKKLR
jgi:predicted transcriptional regulator